MESREGGDGEVQISDGFFRWLWWRVIGCWLTEEAGKAGVVAMDGEVKGKRRQAKISSPKNVDFETIWKGKQQREFHLLIIYLFVIATVSIAYVIGYFKWSFGWLMPPFIVMLCVWRFKMFRIVEDHLTQEHVRVHRKRALRGSETAEWMNFIMNRWAAFSSQGLSDVVKRKLNPILGQFRPIILDHVAVKSFTLGEHAPYIQHIQVFEVSDGLPGGRKQASWYNVGEAPKELCNMEKYQIVMDMEAGMYCEHFRMVLQTKLAGLPFGPDILVENLKIQGRLNLVPALSAEVPFPHMSKVSLSFVEKPNIWFSVKILRTFEVMDLPLLKSWIHNFVMDIICLTLVDPYKFELDLKTERPVVGPTASRAKKQNSKGVLTVTVKGGPSGKESCSEDPQFCVLKVCSQVYSTDKTPHRQSWQDTCSFLICDIKTEKLVLKVKSKKMLSNVTIACYDLHLGNYAFDENNCIEAVLDEKETELDTQLTLTLEYARLPTIVLDAVPPTLVDIPPREVSGVVYLCLHGGVNLLALDKSGTSDPYCVVFANRKKVFSTHYVTETRNPKWDASYEVFVEDFSKTTFTFLCYDWDGNEACDDDFMGAAHLLLTQDEPWVTHKSLTLGYNILNIGAVTYNTNLGSIMVSAIFRPVAAVKRSENSRISVETTIGEMANALVGRKHSSQSRPPTVIRQHTSIRRKHSSSNPDSPKKLSTGVDVFKLLSQGHSILELRIIKARDLMAMDSNGFSDPYCVVKVGKEKKFQTTVKKKTLDPVWDESVTIQMPEGDDKLEIVVWDRDPLMMKDFLGELSFSPEEIKRLSSIGEPGWFLLQKTNTGQIQIKVKVILEDMKGCMDEVARFVTAAEEVERIHSLSSTEGVHSASEMETEKQKPGHIDRNADAYATLPSRFKKRDKRNEVKRSHSDVQVHKTGKFPFSLFRSRSQGGPQHKGHDTVDSGDDTDLRLSDESVSSLDKYAASRDGHVQHKFFDVRGEVVKVQVGDEVVGVATSKAAIYCKIRLDSRSISQRSLKFSPGRVLAKSQPVKQDDSTCMYNFAFEVDRSGGVPADALLILDVKSTHKNQHIATKGYTLRQLFHGSHHQVAGWVNLENDVQVYMELQRSTTQINPKQRGPFSILSLGSTKRKKEAVPFNGRYEENGSDIVFSP
ncbi:uncharacterized protein LOC135493308 [Lineus longissimus]|uniref:uncharacterized protein LOC135493308 n=1 Tax=Lineus longissimus TaxID=88925 RepID=UPI002B4F58CB